ncbi:hypothetical protein [Roseovarius pacificus]|uniref:hypothetical protein n=1 Tax=Roseovarius pacificus TaxID=337701 RepID=UPI00403A2A98
MNSQGIVGGLAWRTGPFLLLVAAILLCLAVLLVNHGPLYYFDTGSYFKQGNATLSLILPEDTHSAGTVGANQIAQTDDTTNGSRSMIYALLVAVFWRLDALGGIALVNLAAVLLSVWLVVRAARRTGLLQRSGMSLIAIPLLAAAVTALPFYVAYVMPDIFAPVLLILIAAVVAMAREMTLTERLAALALAALAVVLHPSHLAIAGLMLPLAVLAALLRQGSGRWFAVGFVACLVLIGFAERKAFEVAAETVAHKQVVYTPFITARLIVDGPGMTYLDENCPRPDLATCALHEALSWSDDPYRLTAAHIIFERSQNLGSFLLMTPEDQLAVAQEQRAFFFRVLTAYPFSTVAALAGNAATQLKMVSVKMTIPTQAVIRSAKSLSGLTDDSLTVLDRGILALDRSWISTADRVHAALYLAALVAVVGLLLWPGLVAGQLKVFVLCLLAGVLVNALICGGVSQPADRYGARVIWLLPFAAAFLAASANAPRRKGRQTAGVDI